MYRNEVTEHMERCRKSAQEASKRHAAWMKAHDDRKAYEQGQAQAREEAERQRSHERQMQQDQFTHQRVMNSQQQAHERRMREMEARFARNNGRF